MMERVLIVDDDEDLLEIMSERLENRGMHVDTVTNPQEALDRIETNPYDAIILDFLMPGMDGLETIKAIKRQKPELRIILLTGQLLPDQGKEAIRLGAADVLEKPADLELLTNKIRTAMAEKALILEDKDEERINEMINRFK